MVKGAKGKTKEGFDSQPAREFFRSFCLCGGTHARLLSECHSQDVGTYVPARGKVSAPVPALGCADTCRHVLTYECYLEGGMC